MSTTRSSAKKKSNQNKESKSGTVESASQNGQLLDQLVLPWVTRDCIINCLSQFPQLLFCTSVPVDMKTKALEKANSLVMTLISLTAGDLQTNDDQRPSKKMRINKSGESKTITGTRFFEISSKLRTELVDQLNRSLNAILCEVSSDEEKNRLYEQNNNLSIKLLSLPLQTVNRAPDQFDPFEAPSNLNLNSLEIATLKTELSDLRENVRSLQAIVKGLDKSEKISDLEITMDYELLNVSSFFLSNDQRYGKTHMCNGLPWSILIQPSVVEENGQSVQYLGIYLRCEHTNIHDWSVKAHYDLRILQPPSNTVWKRNKYFNHFTKSQPGWGNDKFISYKELKSHGLIQNDRLKLQIGVKSVLPVVTVKTEN